MDEIIVFCKTLINKSLEHAVTFVTLIFVIFPNSAIQNMVQNNSALYDRVIYLVNHEFAMVLATMDRLASLPWASTVYFLYNGGSFYFLSSSKSRHISQSLESNVAATVIASQSKSWSDIHGIQMLGTVSEVKAIILTQKILKKYFVKFGQGNDLLPLIRQVYGEKHRSFKKLNVRLYKFSPCKLIYSDNQFGFGFKKEIRLT